MGPLIWSVNAQVRIWIILDITWAGPRCVQELATFLAPQNRIQGRCELVVAQLIVHY